MRLAYFDLDKTILAVNSGSLWVRREVALGHLSKRKALRAASWLLTYTMGFASADSMVEEAVATLRGTSSNELRERTTRFFHEQVRQTYRSGALHAIERHRAAGDRLIMLTSSTNYLAELVADELRFDAVCANELEVDALGLHTGQVVGGLCFGPGKLRHATRAAQKFGGDVKSAAFYTDSFSDVAVMEVVAQPVAVNPDPRLKRRAQQRGWQIVDWGSYAG
ncbi:MAG: HAD-IB family hydrolase [Archangium gephyra]|uniref:HAD-IB family hydrolase n=1 Tax=Archangium gephyra TaxID=48 RepID=A0A2W5UDW5_9BACT|nr:MAG: HAD-IB family hydrolase [Archangium gephyra]